MKQFLKYNFFQIVITFEIRLHAYLQNTWQEDFLIKETKDPFLRGDFDSMDMFTRVTVENALLCFTAPNTKRDSVIPKMTFEFAFAAQQSDLRTFNQAFLPERPKKSLETPLQCLRVIDQKWPLVAELIDLDRFAKKWAWHLSNRISCKTFVYT